MLLLDIQVGFLEPWEEDPSHRRSHMLYTILYMQLLFTPYSIRNKGKTQSEMNQLLIINSHLTRKILNHSWEVTRVEINE